MRVPPRGREGGSIMESLREYANGIKGIKHLAYTLRRVLYYWKVKEKPQD